MFRVFCRKFSVKHEVNSIKDVLSKRPLGSKLIIQGWANSIRKMGKIVFIDINDGSCIGHLQIMCPKNILKTPFHNGSSLSIKGTMHETPKGQLELHADEVDLIGDFDNEEFPFNIKKTESHDSYREVLHLRPKIKYFSTLFRFRSAATFKIHEYFKNKDFIYVHTPILTAADCEGAAETFLVKPQSQSLIQSMKKEKTTDDLVFFDSPAYLTVSSQLHLETLVRSFTQVYTFNACFRAENSVSRLHLSEFYMVEAEEAFVTDLESLLFRIEDFVKELMSFLMTNHLDEINFMLSKNETNVNDHLEMINNIIKEPFKVMTFTEAKELVNKNLDLFKQSHISSDGLTKAEELFLVSHNNNVPVFVVDWPKKSKPFYMKVSKENPDLVKAVDLLVPNVGELCGGSLREENYEILKQQIKELGNTNTLQWYLDLRKFGSVPSAGFGMGFERFLQFFLNIQTIKDTLPFPRWPHHLQM